MGAALQRWFGRLAAPRAALLLWAMLALVMLVTHAQAIRALSTIDPDDALRLVQVRDLIGGQAWWDITQHRINPAGGGGLMHWSRIVDAPLALGIMLLTPLIGQGSAEMVVLALWPLALLGLLFAVVARGFALLGDRVLAVVAVALIATDPVVLFQFAPLRIDHHGWQILLAAGLLALTLRAPGARTGALAGAVAAALIAISLEGLPIIVLFAAIMALAWAWTGTVAHRHRLIAYLATLAGGAVLAQVVTRGPSALWQGWCDALSLPYLSALCVAAVAVAAVAPIMDRRLPHLSARLGMLVIAGALSGAALLAANPLCAAGPFGTLDPLVVDYWYANVHEGLPIWTSIDPVFAFALVPILVGLTGTVLAWRDARGSAYAVQWSVMLAAMAGSAILAMLVLRASSTAHLFAMPGCAWLLIHSWRRARACAGTVPRIAATLLAAMLIPPFSGAALALFVRADAVERPGAAPLMAEKCVDGASAAALDSIAPGVILAPLDIGPHLLQRTHHAVAATGHHRNNAVMNQTIAAFVGDPALAVGRAQTMGANMIVLCPRANEMDNFRMADGDGLADQLTSGRAPAWLQPIALPAGSPLRAWRILSSTPSTDSGQ